MKIVLIRPPSRLGILASQMVHEPLSLTGIASYLIKHNYPDVEVWDYEMERFTEQGFLKRVKESSPAIVGVSCMTPLIVAGHQIAGLTKRVSEEMVTVVGGAHPSVLPKETLSEFPSFDLAVFGEGEETMLEICQRVEENGDFEDVSGLAFRKGKEIMLNKPRPFIKVLDKLPYPARDLIPIQLYQGSPSPGVFGDSLKKISLFTSRGCPYACAFCEVRFIHGRKIRQRSVGNIVGEVKECIQRYGANYFTFKDDTFTIDPNFVEEICKEFKKLNVHWDCKTRVNLVNREMLQKMGESGCKKIFLGVESGSPRILKLIKKNITLTQVKDVFSWAKEVGLQTTAYFMIGSHPSETWEDIKLTNKLMKEIESDFISLSVFTPFPKTEITEMMKEKGLLGEGRWEDFMFGKSNISWRTENFSAEELVKIRKRLLMEYYLRPAFIWKKIKRIRNISEGKYWVKTGTQFLMHLLRD